jgi:hypothetical protein
MFWNHTELFENTYIFFSGKSVGLFVLSFVFVSMCLFVSFFACICASNVQEILQPVSHRAGDVMPERDYE